jgi:uroporphyrinogen decarboxylase
MTMTSRQRIEAALRHQTPDRTPIFEYVLLSPVADQLLGHLYAGDPDNWNTLVHDVGWEQAVRRNANDRIALALMLGHDMLYSIPNPAPASLVPFPTSSPVPDDPVERLYQRNEADAISATAPADNCLLVYVYMQEEMARLGIDLPILAPAYVHGVWSDVDLMQCMVLEPSVAHEHFAQATRHALGSVEKYLALGLDQIGVGGDFAGNKLIISPRAYRAFIVPEVRIVTDKVHAAGRWAVNASDGNLWPVIEDFLFGCDVDGYLEIDMHAGMDMRRLKALYGSKVTLYGNLDCGNTLSTGTPDEIRLHTLGCLEAGMGDGGHILCASNAITASVSLQNYLAVVQAYREFFGLPPANGVRKSSQ